MILPKRKLILGDARQIPLPDRSVHCVITSPPYWGLRDYGVDGQIGLEETPELYVTALVQVFEEVRRVLRDDGTLWLNLGDSYAGSGRGGHIGKCNLEGSRNNQLECHKARGSQRAAGLHENARQSGAIGRAWVPPPNGLKQKDLVGIPWMVAFALRSAGWYLRQDIIWHKPNPMPESVRDRCTKSHEYLFLLSKSERYFFDAEGIKTNALESSVARTKSKTKAVFGGRNKHAGYGTRLHSGREDEGYVRANRRTVWSVSTQPFREAHFATFPINLVLPCIQSGTSERGVCPVCLNPWHRVLEKVDTGKTQKMPDGWDTGDGGHGAFHRQGRQAGAAEIPVTRLVTSHWLPACKCHAGYTIPATVLDPFSGAATTGVAAHRLRRSYIGIEKKQEYLEIAQRRLDREPAITEGLYDALL